jgi:hypothetical protein
LEQQLIDGNRKMTHLSPTTLYCFFPFLSPIVIVVIVAMQERNQKRTFSAQEIFGVFGYNLDTKYIWHNLNSFSSEFVKKKGSSRGKKSENYLVRRGVVLLCAPLTAN